MYLQIFDFVCTKKKVPTDLDPMDFTLLCDRLLIPRTLSRDQPTVLSLVTEQHRLVNISRESLKIIACVFRNVTPSRFARIICRKNYSNNYFVCTSVYEASFKEVKR
jgi:hypothetical protein